MITELQYIKQMKVFKEQQSFTQKWIILLLVGSGIVPIIIILTGYLKGDGSVTLLDVFLTTSITLVVSALIFLFKLTTRIDQDGIHYKFFPFHFKFKTITWSEISKVYVRKYNPISEYGGWGLKGGFFWNKSKGTAYNVSGDIGIQLELKNGKKILIGTNREDQAKQVLLNYTR
jgi:hypothetical protein